MGFNSGLKGLNAWKKWWADKLYISTCYRSACFRQPLGTPVTAACAFICAIFEVLVAVLLKVHVLWDMAPCILLHRYHLFGEVCCIPFWSNFPLTTAKNGASHTRRMQLLRFLSPGFWHCYVWSWRQLQHIHPKHRYLPTKPLITVIENTVHRKNGEV